MKIRLIFLLISYSSIITFSCSKECLLALADLVAAIVVEFDEVNAGENFKFNNLIQNVEASIEACGTEIAPRTETKMNVAYKENESDIFQDISTNNFFEVPGINPGFQANESYEVQFTTPGFYKIETLADGKLEVEERKEDNNNALINGEGRSSSSEPRELIIKVKRGNISNDVPEIIFLTRKVVLEKME